MRKSLTLLLLTLMCVGTWAETHICAIKQLSLDEVQANTDVPVVIFASSKNYSGYENFIMANTNNKYTNSTTIREEHLKSGDRTACVFILRKAEDGTITLRDNQNNYWAKNTSNSKIDVTGVESSDNAVSFTCTVFNEASIKYKLTYNIDETTYRLVRNGGPMALDPTTTDANANWAIIQFYTFSTVEALQSKINELYSSKSPIGKVGYPKATSQAYLDLRAYDSNNGGSVTTSNYNEALDAYTALCNDDDIVLPEEGKTYVFMNISTEGVKHNLYEVTNYSAPDDHKLAWGYPGGGSISSMDNNCYYVCRKNGEYFTFVNAATGNYLIWRGSNTGYNNAKGYTSEYNNDYCRFAIHRPTFNQENMSNASSQADLFGWVCIGGKSDGSDDIYKCFLYSTSGTDNFNQDEEHTERYGNGLSSMFEIKEVTYPYNNVTLNSVDDASYASVYLPFNMTLPEGVMAYKVVAAGDNVLNLEKVGEGRENITKGAYILYSKTVNGTITLLPATSAEVKTATGNLLIGSTTAKAEDLNNIINPYVLNNGNVGVGFYKYAGTQYPLGKAIFSYTGSSSPQFKFAFDDDDLTAIKEAIKEADNKTELRDLQGNIIANPVKGQIYITNGQVIKY